jgi:hypothetical protein
MEILITSKTHKGNAACVGGLIISNNRLVRLLNLGNENIPLSTQFTIGDIWNINFDERPDTEPPHIEDIIITSQHFLRKIVNISKHIIDCGIEIYNGAPDLLYEGKLGWTYNGSGYIANRGNLPKNSVGFWISDSDLKLENDNKHYSYTLDDSKKIKYVGFEPKIKIIPAGTLMRVSLARFWKPDDYDIEERCYLQLSGWYI